MSGKVLVKEYLKRILTKQKYSDEDYIIIKEKRKKHKQIQINFKKKY
jgi:hypothetical protein